METTTITIEQLDTLLSKYFKTLEQINAENELLKQENAKLLLEQQQEEELENSNLTEFQNLVITKLDDVSYNTQFGNNLIYFGIVAFALVGLWVLYHKFLKIFF